MSVSSSSVADRLIAAALAVLGDDATASMAQIAATAGVGRATLHRHFATRDDLVLAIGVRSLDRWEASLRADGTLELVGTDDADAHRVALDALVRRYVRDAGDFRFAMDNPEVERHPALGETVLRLVALETELLASAQRVGVLRDDVPAVWIDHVLFGLLRSGLDAQRYGDVAPRDIPDLVVRTFFAAAGR